MKKLEGKIAWITGAGRGIGRAIALAYASEGADLLLTSRSKNELEETAEAVRQLGQRAIVQVCDVRKSEEIQAAFSAGRESFEKIDILVNNAGVYIYKPFLEFTEEEWNETIDTNLTGIYRCTRVVLPEMMERKRGRIINISSMDGHFGFSNLVPQCAAKAGVIGFTKGLAKEMWDQGIAVTAVCPAEVDKTVAFGTDLGDRPGAPSVKLVPEDIARACVYLASKDGETITGVTLDVYGVGFLAS